MDGGAKIPGNPSRKPLILLFFLPDLLRPSDPSSYLSTSKSSSVLRLRRLRSSFSSDPPGFFLLEAMAEADERREDVALLGRELKFIMR